MYLNSGGNRIRDQFIMHNCWSVLMVEFVKDMYGDTNGARIGLIGTYKDRDQAYEVLKGCLKHETAQKKFTVQGAELI